MFQNDQYFSRPDNTGRALFRYGVHADFDLYKDRVILYGDTNFFTDRELGNKFNPTELDWIVGLAFRFQDTYEISVYREQDRSLDKPGSLIQEYWAVQLRFAFDVPKRMFHGRRHLELFQKRAIQLFGFVTVFPNLPHQPRQIAQPCHILIENAKEHWSISHAI